MYFVAGRMTAMYAVSSEDHITWRGRKEVSLVSCLSRVFASETYSE